MRNPGNLRIPPERIYRGDYTLARNSTVQKMLRMVGFGDNIGSGFSKILKAWKQLQYPTPIILEQPDINEVWLTLPLQQTNVGVNVGDNVGDNVGETTNVGDNVGVNIGNMSEIQITDRQKEIINLIKVSPTITAKQISEALSVTLRTIERNLASLKAIGIVTRKGSDRSGEWIILK